MTPNQLTVKEFFDGEKQYTIPVYQRAYSWEASQWDTFLKDLKEASEGKNHYFFGNVLLEKTKADSRQDIIDGQQRLTTIVIFVRALCNVLKEREGKFNKEKSNEDFLSHMEEDYLINRSKEKLIPVEYDEGYFKELIIRNKDNTHSPQTPSQVRIKNAKKFFIDKLKDEDTEDLVKIFEAMQRAEILSITFNNKKDSILMFELQNNRGKELSNMEKLKSYLSYQIYTCCDDDCEDKLKELTGIFKNIYRFINDIEILDEDQILRYFNISRTDFSYRENDDDRNYKKELKDKKDKVTWIYDYIRELEKAFCDIKDFQNLQSVYRDYLIGLEVWKVYPFIIKAYRIFDSKNEQQSLERIFKALEIIAFRDKLAQTQANLASRLSNILKNFKNKEGVEELENKLKELCNNERYWSDKELFGESIDDGNNLWHIYDNRNLASYILMRYEDYLRQEKAKTKGYRAIKEFITSAQIEHIAPQTQPGQRAKSGYEGYSEDFRKVYLNSIGNLLLIDKSHNCSIGNKPFDEKLKSYEKSPLSQQREIKNFVKSGKWDKGAINKRYEKIREFIKETWSFK